MGPGRLSERRLPDFAVAEFPVTMRDYAAFLDAVHDPGARMPREADGPYLVCTSGRWELAANTVGPEGRRHVPPARELDLPVHGITWYDACAYIAWRAEVTRIAYRLPTAHEWEKAMRGGDDRPFPMGHRIDPAFAKLRLSRPEGAQLEPIGAFPLDQSPYGVRDLAGGIADLTATSNDGAPLPPLSSEGVSEAGVRQALYMGGNWGVVNGMPMRIPIGLRHRTNGVGLRLALSLDQNGSSDLEVAPLR